MPIDPLRVFDLGQLGVQIVASPLHQKPATEVIRAQNAIYDKNSDAGGLTKRGGLAKVNAVALNSGAAIRGGMFVAFPDPVSPLAGSNLDARGFYLVPGFAAGAIEAIYTETPSDWTSEVELNNFFFPLFGNGVGPDFPYPLGVAFPGRIYYAGIGITNGAGLVRGWQKWDGSNDALIAQPAAPPQSGAGTVHQFVPRSIFVFDGKIYCSTNDDASSATSHIFGRVFEINPDTEDMQQIGTSTFGTHAGGLAGGMPSAMAWFEGMLFVATSTSDAAVAPRVYSIRPGVDEDWTLEDNTGTVGLPYSGLHVYKGDLYATTRSLVGGTASIIRRRQNGTWSTVRTNASTTIRNAYLSMATLGANMLVAERDSSVANDSLLILTYDGTTFSTSRNIRTSDFAGTAAGLLHLAGPVFHDGYVYYNAHMTAGTAGDVGSVLIRNNGGGWASVRSRLNTDPDISTEILEVLRD